MAKLKSYARVFASSASNQLTGVLPLGKRIGRSHSPVKTIVLKILGNDLLKAVVFSIRPKMRVEPAEAVRSGGAQREAQDPFGGIKNGELTEKLFRFATSFVRRQQRTIGDQRACNNGDELDDGLMRHANRIRGDALTKQICRDALLFRKSWVVAIYQDIRIN